MWKCLQKDWLPIKAIVCSNDNDTEHNLPLDITLVSFKEEMIVVATGAAGDPSEVLEVIEDRLSFPTRGAPMYT